MPPELSKKGVKKMSKWVSFKEIKEMVSMTDVLNHYGLFDKLKQKGDYLVGACPIHKGKNKNKFHVSLSKNNFNCFGDCQGGGNILDFVSKMEGVDIRQAGLLLKEWFEIEPGEKKPKKDLPKKAELPKEERVNKPLKFALKYLNPEHPYIKERRLRKETIEEFGLGYCQKGIMAGRIAIPIHNEHGQLVAYIGRWPEDPPEEEPKYKLPAGFHKSLVLYNFHRAIESAKKQGLILVEGVFDCLKVWQAGFPNVSALMGANLSYHQEELILEALAPQGKVLLMFDEDNAGRACRNHVLECLSTKLFVKVISLGKEGLQPDSLTEQEIKEKIQ